MSDTTDRSSHADRHALLPRAVCAQRGGVAVACALAAVGVIFLWQAALLDLGDIGLPGPGFFPLLLGAALVGLSVRIAIDRWRQSAGGQTLEIGHRDVLIVSAALLAVPLLFEPLGAYITLGLFGAALLVVIARTPVWLAGAAALVAMAACWYFFQVLLGLQLPTGPL